jgi:hypothetical protein
MDVDLIAQQIRSYAASPTEDGLDELSKSFDACREEHVNLDDDIVRAEVLACVLKLSSAIQSQPQELRGWNCLCFLVSMGWCKRSADTITAFASTSACGPLLAHCGTVISSSQVHDEIRFSFEFIYRFMVNTDTRREMVYNTVGLPGAVFRYLSERFSDAPCELQTQALNAAWNIVALFYSGFRKDDGILLLRGGALPAVKQATFHVFSLGVKGGHEESVLLRAATNVLWTTLSTARKLPAEQLPSLSDEVYKLSRNDVYRISVISLRILTVLPKSRMYEYDMFFIGCGEYLLDALGPVALRSYLLHKPPLNSGGRSIASRLADCATYCSETWREKHLMKALRRFAAAVPEVAEVLSALPPPPQRVAKDRCCTLPDCFAVGDEFYTNFKKCGRCMAVYYCGRQHQVQHWPEHRLCCVKATPAAVEVQGADYQQAEENG